MNEEYAELMTEDKSYLVDTIIDLKSDLAGALGQIGELEKILTSYNTLVHELKEANQKSERLEKKLQRAHDKLDRQYDEMERMQDELEGMQDELDGMFEQLHQGDLDD